MSKQQEKMMADLQRLLASQNFESEADLRKFMDSLTGKEIPSFPKAKLTPQEQAQDLIFEAYELPPAKAKQYIQKALRLDSNCIEAYEWLGSMEDTPEIATAFFEKGIAIGRQIFGGTYIEQNKGYFWGLHETRPFMRCLQHYADCLLEMGKIKESAAVLEEMIELNPNDNQGVRNQLLLCLLELDAKSKFEKYDKMFKEDSMAFALFTRALFLFKTEGESEKANKQLQKALKQNKFVATKLLSRKGVSQLAHHYSPGQENEADYYVYFAQDTWQNTRGATAWLKKHSKKS